MKVYKVPVTFEAWGLVEVEAENFGDLMKKLADVRFLDEMPLPLEWDYVTYSYEVDRDGL